MNLSPETMRLYAVTDRICLKSGTLLQAVEKAIRGGATLIQLREKQLDDSELIQQAAELKQLCSQYGVPLIINDRVDIALKSGADGVHLGQGDMPPKQARELLGPNAIIGVSARTVEQALAAEAAGADYLGSGAVFSTSTKGDAKPLPLPVLKDICHAVRIPVVAIGGIGEKNILELRGCGISGVAVVSSIFGADDIESAAKRLAALSCEITQTKEGTR